MKRAPAGAGHRGSTRPSGRHHGAGTERAHHGASGRHHGESEAYPQPVLFPQLEHV